MKKYQKELIKNEENVKKEKRRNVLKNMLKCQINVKWQKAVGVETRFPRINVKVEYAEMYEDSPNSP